MSFEILRNMEAFTKEMFNQIIAFQEKEHPAWNEDLSFQERIAKLPLHYLMFSNPDRNPETHGPSVAHFYPLNFEIAKIDAYAKAVSDDPVLCDIHTRNGFIGSLFAEQGLKTIGLKDPNEKPNQIENFHTDKNYEVKNGTVADVDFPVDILFSSWMPAGENITDDIIRINPKLVVYVFTEHINEYSKERQTGTDSSFGEELPESFKLIEEWAVTRPKDLLHEVWPDLSPSIEETRFVRIYANEGFHDISVDEDSLNIKPYAWESELLMADTALEAKKQMAQQGFPVKMDSAPI